MGPEWIGNTPRRGPRNSSHIKYLLLGGVSGHCLCHLSTYRYVASRLSLSLCCSLHFSFLCRTLMTTNSQNSMDQYESFLLPRSNDTPSQSVLLFDLEFEQTLVKWPQCGCVCRYLGFIVPFAACFLPPLPFAYNSPAYY